MTVTNTITASALSTYGDLAQGPKDRKTRLTLAFDGCLAAGLALDLSAAALGGYNYITETHWGPGGVIADGCVFCNLFGTKKAVAPLDGSISASTCKVGVFGTLNDVTTNPGLLGALPDSTVTGVATQCLTVHGY